MTIVIKILLVEDDVLQTKLAGMVLSALHYQVDTASTGNEALEKFFIAEYDLVFMDIGLPDIDGIEVARQIRERNQTTPIVALTAHDDETRKKAALAAGMSDYLVKPITIEKVQNTVHKWVQR